MLRVSARFELGALNEFFYENAVQSRYVERIDEEVNPNYVRLLEAVRAQEGYVHRLEVSFAANGGFILALALGNARNKLINLQNTLAGTPMTVRVPRYEPYEYSEVGFKSWASLSGDAELIDQTTGTVLRRAELREHVDSYLAIRAGVSSSDEVLPARLSGRSTSEHCLRERIVDQTARYLVRELAEHLGTFWLFTARFHQQRAPVYALKRRLQDILIHREGLLDGSVSDDQEWLESLMQMDVDASHAEIRSPRSTTFPMDPGQVGSGPKTRQPMPPTVASGTSVVDTLESVQDAVVRIDGFGGFGSGFHIPPGNRVLTNAHVAGEVSEFVIVRTVDGGAYVGEVIASDMGRDLALISAGTFGTFIELADEGVVRIGQEVIAVGNPRGLSFSATRGIVSQLREVGEVRLVQHDAAINPGSSGGPLLDREARALGINTIKLSGSEGLGFAVTSGEIQEFLSGVPIGGEVRRCDGDRTLESESKVDSKHEDGLPALALPVDPQESPDRLPGETCLEHARRLEEHGYFQYSVEVRESCLSHH